MDKPDVEQTEEKEDDFVKAFKVANFEITASAEDGMCSTLWSSLHFLQWTGLSSLSQHQCTSDQPFFATMKDNRSTYAFVCINMLGIPSNGYMQYS